MTIEDYSNKNILFDEPFPNIVIYKNVLSYCNEIIDFCEKNGQWTESGIISEDGTDLKDKDFRVAESMSLPISFTNPTEWFDLAKIIWFYGNHYAIMNNIKFSEMEQLRIVRYPTGTGKYEPHYDSCPSAPRIFSCVLYLNTIESGGETFFPKFNFGVQPVFGDIVFFPANYAYLHESRICENKKKYIIVTQFREQIEV